MNVWLVQTGELHPFQPGGRKMRTAMLADALRARGHRATWWSTNFFHPTKTLLAPGYHEVDMAPGYQIRLLRGLPYRKNVSLRRYAHYKLLGWRFTKMSEQVERPDIIVAALPDLDLTAAMVRYARRHNVPILVDIQDLWPDIFLTPFPKPVRWLGRTALHYDFTRAKASLRGATGLVACSDTYLNWGLARADRVATKSDGTFYHGYPTPKVAGEPSPKFRELLRPLEGKTVFAFVGTFGRSYDIDLLLDTAEKISQSHPHIRFVIAGSGEKWKAAAERAATLPNVVLPGWLGADEIASLLLLAHVGLVTYTAGAPQSLSYKPFEYMAYGLPLLSSLPGEMENLVKKHDLGVSYRAGDREDFTAKVLFMAEDRARLEAVASNVRTTFSRQFSVNHVYDGYASHVESVHDRFQKETNA